MNNESNRAENVSFLEARIKELPNAEQKEFLAHLKNVGVPDETIAYLKTMGILSSPTSGRSYSMQDLFDSFTPESRERIYEEVREIVPGPETEAMIADLERPFRVKLAPPMDAEPSPTEDRSS